uniref:Si:dkey-103g5.3 n=1 Tax=Sphaeramia orbicularis TaxID=375764 RepID=A0A673A9D7_9TELE
STHIISLVFLSVFFLENSDLSVDCGTTIISLEINYCTAKWSGFNYTNLALNGKHNTTECQGSLDTSVNPPVIRFQLPINQSQDNPSPDPTGPFSQFLSVQSVIITSFIDTPRSDQGVISYSTDLYYHFSCRYPLEYLINNTEIVADNNGTFIKNLKMGVYNDSSFAFPLMMPSTGLELRTTVYVEVKAINLTGNFHVLLDHCFGTPTAYNMTNTEQHNFFTGCSVDQRTVVLRNGLSTVARFNFEAFRFVQHRNQAKSSLYLHCILRLCEPDQCQSILAACNNRKRRSVTPFGEESSESATISVGPLYTSIKSIVIVVALMRICFSLILSVFFSC